MTLRQIVIFIDESDSIKLLYSTEDCGQFTEQSTGQIQAQVQDPADLPNNPQLRESHMLQTWPSFSVNFNSQALTYPYESPCRFACVCLDKDPSILEKSPHGQDEGTSDAAWIYRGNVKNFDQRLQKYRRSFS